MTPLCRVNRRRRESYTRQPQCDSLEPRTLFATLWVINTNDSGHGSLRAAILQANATAATDTIKFNIAGAWTHTVTPLTQLPTITSRTIVDATTQSGYSTDNPRIVLDGVTAAALDPLNDDLDGLTISAGKSEVRGLVIQRFTGDGIELMAGLCKVQACFIGTSVTGLGARPNGHDGIRIANTGFNLIGGTTAANRNVIAANGGAGVSLSGDAATNNTISGNYIGLGVDGVTALGNQDGIRLTDGAHNNTIGGTSAGARNIISGNDNAGILMLDEETTGNNVYGNYIGTTANGKTARANSSGIFVDAAGYFTIGGNTTGHRNLISGNTTGINMTGGPDFNDEHNIYVYGNYLGTKTDGVTPLPNNTGIFINGGSGVRIGGTGAGRGNVISGNTHDGISVIDFTDGRIEGNRIGVDVTGNVAVPNNDDGIYVDGDFDFNDNLVRNNVISANEGSGFHVTLERAHMQRNTFQGNLIGTNQDGTVALGNGGDGLTLSGADNLIGGTGPGEGNIISANGGLGILIADNADLAETAYTADDNQILGNRIGTDVTGTLDFGNGGHGIQLSGAAADGDHVSVRRTAIGDGTAAGRNVISGNGGYGVLLNGETVIDTRVQGNYIGTNAAGTGALSNHTGVVLLNDTSANRIGGELAGQGNLISGNGAQGILINSGATGSLVRGNRIGTAADGTNALGNAASGVLFGPTAGDGNTIGYDGDGGVQNTIAFNGGAGIRVNGGTGQSFVRNSIFSNAQIGIDLDAVGVTPNDALDADAGPNGLQNFAVLTEATYDGAHLTITGSLSSAALDYFMLDFYSDSVAAAQGRSYLGRVTVMTDALGVAAFSVDIATASAGTFITALTTAATGSTSEFSAAIAVN